MRPRERDTRLRVLEDAATVLALIANLGIIYDLWSKPSTPFMYALRLVIPLAFVVWFFSRGFLETKTGHLVDSSGRTSDLKLKQRIRVALWARPRNRRALLVVCVATAVFALYSHFWANLPPPGTTRILIADLDQDCLIREKSPLKHRIRRELQDNADKSGVKIEVLLLSDPLRPDETRRSALDLMSRNHAHILIWGNYTCTQSDVEIDVRAELNLPRVEWKWVRLGGARQAGISELNSMKLQNIAARSTTGVILLVLAHAESVKRNWSRVRDLSEDAARVAMESLGTASKIDSGFESAHERWLVASSQLLSGFARGQLGDLEGSAHASSLATQDPSVAPAAFNNWGNALYEEAIQENDAHSDALLAAAIEKYAQSSRLKPEYGFALRNWGNALYVLAGRKSGDEAALLFQSACERFAAASRLDSGAHDFFEAWGTSLYQLARTKSQGEAEALFRDAIDKFSQLRRAGPQSPESYYLWGSSLYELARAQPNRTAKPHLREAIEKFASAIQLKPDFPEALFLWGSSLYALASSESPKDSEQLLMQAIAKCSSATRIKPTLTEAYYVWGMALYRLGRLHRGPSGLEHFRQAALRFSDTVRQMPEHSSALYYWGLTLFEIAELEPGDGRLGYLLQSHEKYRETLRIKSDHYAALVDWGNTMVAIAAAQSGANSERWFSKATANYQEALRIKPNYHWAPHNWGAALAQRARMESGSTATKLLTLACEKFAEAIRIEPDSYLTYLNWGGALSHRAARAKGVEREALWAEAIAKLVEAEKIKEGVGAYNLACIAVLRGNKAEAHRLLRRALELDTMPSQSTVLLDTDLDSVRSEPWFSEIVAKAPKFDAPDAPKLLH